MEKRFNELEQEVVKKHKEGGFAAYLQWAWLEYLDLKKDITKRNYPERERLFDANKTMNKKRVCFDCCYLNSLPKMKVNPLKVEQEAWKLLSPPIKQYVDEFGKYIQDYSPQTAEQKQLLAYLECGLNLLQKWNVLSDSYKPKYELAIFPKLSEHYLKLVYEEIAEKENLLKNLIKELSVK